MSVCRRDTVAFIKESEDYGMYGHSCCSYCLELHNQAVKALRFPPKSAAEIETIEQQREREQQVQ